VVVCKYIICLHYGRCYTLNRKNRQYGKNNGFIKPFHNFHPPTGFPKMLTPASAYQLDDYSTFKDYIQIYEKMQPYIYVKLYILRLIELIIFLTRF